MLTNLLSCLSLIEFIIFIHTVTLILEFNRVATEHKNRKLYQRNKTLNNKLHNQFTIVCN